MMFLATQFINPQPLPPYGLPALYGSASLFNLVALNPQPLPPGPAEANIIAILIG